MEAVAQAAASELLEFLTKMKPDCLNERRCKSSYSYHTYTQGYTSN